MRITFLAVGQIRGSKEAALFDDYSQRIQVGGRAIGITHFEATEIKTRKGLSGEARANEDRAQITNAIQAMRRESGALTLILLDERGKTIDSREFSGKVNHWMETGNICFVLGGADGFDDSIRSQADFILSLGKMVFPHLLARVFLAEQVWRAISILSNHPYHRY